MPLSADMGHLPGAGSLSVLDGNACAPAQPAAPNTTGGRGSGGTPAGPAAGPVAAAKPRLPAGDSTASEHVSAEAVRVATAPAAACEVG